MAGKKIDYITIKETAKLFDRSPNTIKKYIQSRVLLVYDKDPQDNVTSRLIRGHVEVRIELYQHLQRPGIKMNQKEVGELLCRICSENDEKLSGYLKLGTVKKVIKQLKIEVDELIENFQRA